MVLSVLMPLSFYPHEMSNFNRYGIFIPISYANWHVCNIFISPVQQFIKMT